MAGIPQLRARVAAAKDAFSASRLGQTLERFNEAKGSVWAAAITYAGFLAFFPILALSLTAASHAARIYPGAEDVVLDSINLFIPGVVGDGDGQISLSAIARASGAVTTIGFLMLAYTGSGWMTSMRQGLNKILNVPDAEQPSFIKAKAKDLSLLVVLGLTLGTSIAASSMVLGFLPGWTRFVAPLVGVAVSTVFFMVIFRLVPDEHLPWSTVRDGAVVAAVGFEALKFVMVQIVGGVAGSPLAALAIAATVLVWIGFFARLTLLGGAWVATRSEP